MSSANDPQQHHLDLDVTTINTIDSGLEADASGPALVQETEPEVEDDLESAIEVDVGMLLPLLL
jgi:hypothetical protein